MTANKQNCSIDLTPLLHGACFNKRQPPSYFAASFYFWSFTLSCMQTIINNLV